jgi:hypothetical protein
LKFLKKIHKKSVVEEKFSFVVPVDRARRPGDASETSVQISLTADFWRIFPMRPNSISARGRYLPEVSARARVTRGTMGSTFPESFIEIAISGSEI